MKIKLLYPLLLTALILLSACSETTRLERLTLCTEPRPQVCTQDYDPVEAEHFDGTRQTYSNACMACSHEQVKGIIRSSSDETQN
jgi:cytochrome c5